MLKYDHHCPCKSSFELCGFRNFLTLLIYRDRPMCWRPESEGIVNIYALLILLLIDSVLRQLLSSHYSLHLFCVWDFISIRDMYKQSEYIWEIGPSKSSSYCSVRIAYSSLSTPWTFISVWVHNSTPPQTIVPFWVMLLPMVVTPWWRPGAQRSSF